MKKKLLGIFVCILLIAATGITVAGTLKLKTDSSEGKGVTTASWGWYDPTGSWLRNDNEVFIDIMPAGPEGWRRYALESEIATINPIWYGYFPTAVALTDMHGNMVATGKNTYDFSVMQYATDEDRVIVYFLVWSGTFVVTSEDTGNGAFSASFYLPDQDPFGNEEPYLCYPAYEYSYYRIPVIPPCTP